MEPENTLLLTASDVASLLTVRECISTVEDALRMMAEGTAAAPGFLSVHAQGGGFHVKAGILNRERAYFAAKVNANFPANPVKFKLPTIQGVIVLCDARDGRRLAVMDSMVVTGMRTGAATAVAAKYLARENASVATVVGCGSQSQYQLRSLLCVRRLRQVYAFDVDAEKANTFAREMEQELGISVRTTDELNMSTRQSDICVTCTTSRQPILGAQSVGPGAFIAAVGADNPEKQELDPLLFSKNKIVVDMLAQCQTMGDLHHALRAGVIKESQVHGELGQVVAGLKAGRESEDEIIVFDSTGLALQDVAAAAIIYEKARSLGRGLPFDFAGLSGSVVSEPPESMTS